MGALGGEHGGRDTRSRGTAVALVVGLLAAGAVGAGSATSRHALTGPTLVRVTAGAPSKLAFTLSRSAIPAGIVTFAITNRGRLSHAFKICTLPVKAGTENSCAGLATKMLRTGQSARLTVTLIEPGRYEYLSTLPGQAAAGMKGLITVEVPTLAPAPPRTSSVPGSRTCAGRCSPTPTVTASSKPPAVESLVGDPTVGAPLFAANCGSCHILAAAGSTGTAGPNLDEFAPTQEQLVGYMENGSDSMPAYGGVLSGTQINAIAAYVYQATHQ